MGARVPRRKRSRLGATLAEGIVAVFISSIFLSVLPAFYQTSVKVWQRESSEMAVVQTADFAVKRMEEDVRNARSVSVSSDGLTVTLTLPLKAYDSDLGREVNVLCDGWLVDGDQVQYYFVYDTSTSSYSCEGALYRRVILAGGAAESPVVIADHVQPTINPLNASTGSPLPIFSFDPVQRTLTVIVTAAEPKPSSGTFAPKQSYLTCARDGGQLYRIPTDEHPQGELRCSLCGEQVETSGEIVTYQTRYLVRNQ
jgi:hypothetical protein